MAITKFDQFDFLIDIVPRDELKPPKRQVSWERIAALEKEMATHSSVLSRRVPGTGEPVGLLSMGSHRVGHDCRDLVAAAAANPLHVCNPIEFDGSRIWLEMQAQYAQGYLKIPQE